jgi:hypothetical protein
MLYHASLDILERGQTLPMRQVALPEQMMAASTESMLEQLRPARCQSRLSAYFAACTPEQALVVKHGMSGNDGKQIDPAIHIYEVEADGDTRCPMMLVQTVKVLLELRAQQKQTRCVAAAYWTTADQPWYFIEVLTPRIRVEREVVLDRSFEIVWREVNDAYKSDQPIATNIVRGCQ